MSSAARFLSLGSRLSLRNVGQTAAKHQTRTMFGRGPSDANRDFQSLIRDMETSFNHLYQDIGRTFRVPRAVPTLTTGNEEGHTYRLNIDMLGFKPEDIKVSLNERLLSIHATMERKNGDGNRFYQEIIREYSLPEKLDVEKLKSQLDDDGVLRIEAPLPADAEKPRQIAIDRQTNTKTIE